MKKGVLIAVLLSQTACFHGIVVASGRPGVEHSETGVSWLWGLTNTKTAAVECRNGLASAGSYLPWYAFLLSGITLGIVTPVVKEYSCLDEQPAYAPAPPAPR